MRTKVTRKQIADNYYCIAIGADEAQHLLAYASSPYYTAGLYGWNFDAYTFELNGTRVCITTGYRGMIRNGRAVYTYDMVNAYDKQAADIMHDQLDSKRERVTALLNEFLVKTFSFLFEEGAK